MSQPEQKQDDTAAAVGFGALLLLAAGWAGLIVAACAVGFERSWSRRGGGRDLRDANRRDRYGDHLAWLAQDRATRDRYRQARQDWWTSGAHGPAPKGPGLGQRIGGWLRRTWGRMYVAGHDFAAGFAEGWRAADEARRRGASPRDVARTRPTRQPDGSAPDQPPDTPATTPAETSDPPNPPSSSNPPQHVEGVPVSQQTNTDRPAPAQAPQGDTNAAVMAAHLQQIETRQTRISELVDQLAAERAAVETEVTAAAEFAEQTGQTAETRQALDASTAVVAQLGEQVGGVSDSATEAADQLASARQGLRVVEEAEDALTSAGADGRAVAPAGAGA